MLVTVAVERKKKSFQYLLTITVRGQSAEVAFSDHSALLQYLAVGELLPAVQKVTLDGNLNDTASYSQTAVAIVQHQ